MPLFKKNKPQSTPVNNMTDSELWRQLNRLDTTPLYRPKKPKLNRAERRLRDDIKTQLRLRGLLERRGIKASR